MRTLRLERTAPEAYQAGIATKSFSALLAGRYLNPLRNAVSVITAILVLGVALGVSALIVILSVMAGLEAEIKGRILGFSPHITLSYAPMLESEEAPDWREKADEWATLPGVEGSYGLIEDYVILEYRENQQPVNFRAIDTQNEEQIQSLEELLDTENYPDAQADLGYEPEAVISSGLVNSLGLQIGETFSLYSTRNLKAVKSAFEETDRDRASVSYAAEIDQLKLKLGKSPKVEGEYEIFKLEELQNIFYLFATIYEGEIRQGERLIIEPALDRLSEVGPEPNQNSSNRRVEKGSTEALIAIVDELESFDIEAADKDAVGNIKELVLPKEIETKGIYQASAHVRSPDVFIPLEIGQELLGVQDEVQSVALRLEDPFKAAEFAEELQASVGEEWVVKSWMESFGLWFELLAREQYMMSFIFFILGLIVTFCISAVMFTVTLQKKQEIGVMKALGANENQIVSVFMIQGVIVGVIGAVLGVIIGVLILINRSSIQKVLASFGADPFPAAFHGVPTIPALYSWSTYSWVAIGAFLLCILAAVIPAIIAAKNDPARSLRGL